MKEEFPLCLQFGITEYQGVKARLKLYETERRKLLRAWKIYLMNTVDINAKRDLSIAGDVVGRDKIINYITLGLGELPTRYDSRVQNFLEYYLGAKDHRRLSVDETRI